MYMTNDGICRDYRLAKKPMKQISVLAELNNCGRDKIVEILKEGGEELPGQYKPKQKGPREPKEPVQPAPAVEEKLPEKKDDDEYVKVREILPIVIGQAALHVIAEIADEAYDPAGKAHRIEGVLALWREVVERCEDE